MASPNEEIAQDITDTILTGGARTMALSFRIILNKILNSFPNFKNGGKLFEVEVGYLGAFRPGSAGAFATVDMLGGVSEVTDSATIALLEDESNWTDLKHYNGPAITMQYAGDFYINDDYDYKFYTNSGTITVRRIPYGFL